MHNKISSINNGFMALKTGSDLPVQPWTSLYPSPVSWKNQKFKKYQKKSVTGGLIGVTGNRPDPTGFETNQDEEEKARWRWIVDHPSVMLPLVDHPNVTPPTSPWPTSRRHLSVKNQIKSTAPASGNERVVKFFFLSFFVSISVFDVWFTD